MQAFPLRRRRGPTALLLLLLLLLPVLLLSGCQQAYFGAINLRPAGEAADSAQYDAIHDLRMDIYRPVPAATKAPVVVFFYGGSWRNGQREYYRFVGNALANAGVLVLIPDYRKSPAHPFPAFMQDSAKAVAWAFEHAEGLGGDRRRIHLMGHSAGAHIAALIGTDGRLLDAHGLAPRDLAGVIGLAGPYDFLPITNAGLLEVFGTGARWADSQPINFVDGDEPAFLLLHGAKDRRVRALNSERLAQRLRANGASVDLRIVPNTGHVGLVNGFLSPRFSPVLERTLDWVGASRGATPPR